MLSLFRRPPRTCPYVSRRLSIRAPPHMPREYPVYPQRPVHSVLYAIGDANLREPLRLLGVHPHVVLRGRPLAGGRTLRLDRRHVLPHRLADRLALDKLLPADLRREGRLACRRARLPIVRPRLRLEVHTGRAV